MGAAGRTAYVRSGEHDGAIPSAGVDAEASSRAAASVAVRAEGTLKALPDAEADQLCGNGF